MSCSFSVAWKHIKVGNCGSPADKTEMRDLWWLFCERRHFKAERHCLVAGYERCVQYPGCSYWWQELLEQLTNCDFKATSEWKWKCDDIDSTHRQLVKRRTMIYKRKASVFSLRAALALILMMVASSSSSSCPVSCTCRWTKEPSSKHFCQSWHNTTSPSNYRFGVIVAKGVKISTDQFFPPKN